MLEVKKCLKPFLCVLILSSLDKMPKTASELLEDIKISGHSLTGEDIYPTLYKLSVKKLIVGEDKKTKRRKKYFEYSITKEGKTALEELKQSWADFSRSINENL